jgi:uncharacterized protein YbjT (DUF2867 family)
MTTPATDSGTSPITTVAVTGATGFIGRAVVAALLERGYTVRALIRDREKARRVLPGTGQGKLHMVAGDAGDSARVAELLKGCQACINLVGIIKETRNVATGKAVTFRKSHVEATRTLVAGCLEGGVRRYIQMSALGVTPNGVSEYQKTKFEAENIVRLSTLEWTIVRPGLVHGPDGEFVHLIKDMLTGQIPPYFFAPYFQRSVEDKRVPMGSVTQIDPKVQPVAVEDVAAAFVASLAKPETIGEVYNLVGSEVLEWPTMIRFMRDAMHAGKLEPWGIPAEVAAIGATVAGKLGFGSALPFDAGMARMAAQDATASLDKVRAELGIEPKPFRATFTKYASAV